MIFKRNCTGCLLLNMLHLNSQAAYNAAKDANGYMQGGLGDGVTIWDGTSWSDFNEYNPLIPCGHTDSLGNASGFVAYTIKDLSQR